MSLQSFVWCTFFSFLLVLFGKVKVFVQISKIAVQNFEYIVYEQDVKTVENLCNITKLYTNNLKTYVRY